jgi:hypothetical protein
MLGVATKIRKHDAWTYEPGVATAARNAALSEAGVQ